MREHGEATRKPVRSAERPNEEQRDEWLDRLVRRADAVSERADMNHFDLFIKPIIVSAPILICG